jgi:hypothetical protein
MGRTAKKESRPDLIRYLQAGDAQYFRKLGVIVSSIG